MILKIKKLYYGNSALLNKLKYTPFLIAYYCIVFCLGLLFYRSTKIATKQTLGWNGKKETHQIGTPLSSLIGWVEILKSENVDESTTIEIEKILSDYKPLQTVSQNWLRTHIRKERETLQSYTYLSIPL
jgi:hypothetical protein